MIYKVMLNYNWGRELDESLVADDFVINTTEHFIIADSLDNAKLKAEKLREEERRLVQISLNLPYIGIEKIMSQRELIPYIAKIKLSDEQEISRVVGVKPNEDYKKTIESYLKRCSSSWLWQKRGRGISIEEIIKTTTE